MDNEKILLDALNTFGNFISVEQEFNNNQLEVIYKAMNQVLHIASVVERNEQLPQIHGLIKCECGKVYDVDVENVCPSCGN